MMSLSKAKTDRKPPRVISVRRKENKEDKQPFFQIEKKKAEKSNYEPIHTTNDWPVEFKVPKEAKKPEPETPLKKECGKIVVYTCVTGGYDNLIKPFKVDCVDYVCFTDNMGVDPKGWELRPIPEELKDLSKVKQQRMIKVLPHKYLPEYDISIWVDGSVEVKADVKEFIKPFIYDGHCIFIPEHPVRNCIYKERDAVKALKKDTTDLPDRQMKKYKEEGYPERNGLVQSNIMVRWHNDEDCVKVMEIWAKEIRELSHRDQLSFNYALWKAGLPCFKALDKKTCNSNYFKWNVKHNVKTAKKK